jgi:hypothetical protein
MASRRKRSRTPSAASLAQRDSERLASLTFFLDYQIGRFIVAQALRQAGARVEVHLDHFPQAAPDTDWIPEIGRRDWVLITKDQNIRRNPLERAAYEAARLRGFVVTGKDMEQPSGSDPLERKARSISYQSFIGYVRGRGKVPGSDPLKAHVRQADRAHSSRRSRPVVGGMGVARLLVRRAWPQGVRTGVPGQRQGRSNRAPGAGVRAEAIRQGASRQPSVVKGVSRES